MKALDVMHRELITTTAEATVDDPVRLMVRNRGIPIDPRPWHEADRQEIRP